ncbi:ATP-binding protein [Microbacterium sp. X-17]|uniref:sensor histidine kinase n=1 Tax=Microbacterium sp. X-17 TaxID=3144404 RepID=UPI0031F55D93
MDERDRAVLADAWRYIPTGRAAAEALGSFSRTRIDRMIALLIGIACIVHGAQALTAAIQPEGSLTTPRLWVTVAGFLALSVMTVACLINVFARTASALFACVYLATLLVWPFVDVTPGYVPPETQWPFFLIDIAIAAAVVAFRLPLQITWAIAAPLLYGLARLVGAGFAPEAWLPIISEVSFALLLGGALVALAWTIRSAAGHVDAVRGEAVTSYARAAAEDASENERVTVAALMHDSVLGALLAAERAQTPREQALAVTMAREALAGLHKADADDGDVTDEIIDDTGVADQIQRALNDLGMDLTVRRESDGGAGVRLSSRVARVIVLAAMQAIANAVQHAEAAGLAVTVRTRSAPAGVVVVVSDRGPGFDLDAVPADRLGVRGSIIARTASIGGHAHIQSGPEGTVVTIEWESGDRW